MQVLTTVALFLLFCGAGVENEEHEASNLQGEAAMRQTEREQRQLRIVALQKEVQREEEDCMHRETGTFVHTACYVNTQHFDYST